jgi:hypothetical protein
MKNFEPILDAYQLAEGSVIKEKDQDEIFELGQYDAEKKGYEVFPFENGVRFEDFTMVVSEDELMDNYLVETESDDDNDDEESEDPLLSDSL